MCCRRSDGNGVDGTDVIYSTLSDRTDAQRSESTRRNARLNRASLRVIRMNRYRLWGLAVAVLAM